MQDKELQKIPIDKIKIPEVRADSLMTEEQKEFLRASIEKYGITDPILVRPIEGGFFELIYGKNRVLQAKEQGLAEIDALVSSVSNKDAVMLHLAENLARGKTEPISVAKVLKKAVDSGATEEEIAKNTGHTVGWVKFYLSLLGLPEVYQKAITNGRLSLESLKVCSQLKELNEVDACLSTVVRLGWSSTQAADYVRRRSVELAMAEEKSKELGRPVEAPEPKPEELIAYDECSACKRRFPKGEVMMRILCPDCNNLLEYVLDMCGGPKEAMKEIYKALKEKKEREELERLKKKFEKEETETPEGPKEEGKPPFPISG